MQIAGVSRAWPGTKLAGKLRVKFFPAFALALVLGAITAIPPLPLAQAQIVDTTITAGATFSLAIDATKIITLPVCSKSAHCAAHLRVCTIVKSPSLPQCFDLDATGGGSALFSLVVNDTTGGVTTPTSVGTLYVQVPPRDFGVAP